MNRKSFLKNSTALLGGAMLPSFEPSSTTKKKSIRFAHITDIHLKPGIIPETGMAKAFQHAQKLQPHIDFIMNGGDSIMDALEAEKDKTKKQWELFHSILKNENSSEIHHCIGNHDIWGWFSK